MEIILPLLEISTVDPKKHLKVYLYYTTKRDLKSTKEKLEKFILSKQNMDYKALNPQKKRPYYFGYKSKGWKKISKLGKYASFVGLENSTVILIEGHTGKNIGYAFLKPRPFSQDHPTVLNIYNDNA